MEKHFIIHTHMDKNGFVKQHDAWPQTSKEGIQQQLSSPGRGESSRAGNCECFLRNALIRVIIIGNSFPEGKTGLQTEQSKTEHVLADSSTEAASQTAAELRHKHKVGCRTPPHGQQWSHDVRFAGTGAQLAEAGQGLATSESAR